MMYLIEAHVKFVVERNDECEAVQLATQKIMDNLPAAHIEALNVTECKQGKDGKIS